MSVMTASVLMRTQERCVEVCSAQNVCVSIHPSVHPFTNIAFVLLTPKADVQENIMLQCLWFGC